MSYQSGARARAMAVVIAAVVLGGCSSVAPLPSGAIAVPTDHNVVSSIGTHIMCTASAAIPAVEGGLDGDASDAAWPVW